MVFSRKCGMRLQLLVACGYEASNRFGRWNPSLYERQRCEKDSPWIGLT
jgi:hypothetical protein